ncbi:MAG: zinc ribbon domain-containing protein [Chloroflexi bacterium]|nr:zinc ribbon domain-containing protein [Chloroflexota bacterium]MBI2976856.1 zinc ribbon domain-containing protein [Chloroflexota bacterium]MBI3176729.1 zinc ribbon domain-containing protein [Chloroflexota bacterium]MBI4315880.1 zinc ribbon domain-containing protein [Chloroflexota bacterium]MBI5293330.1 zinc ribbon domain-containing protein [Chloroflexota bacterium]
MPLYEYRCLSCQQKVGVRLSYAEYDTAKPKCPLCGSPQLKRLISRVRIAKSEEARMESLADPSSFGDLDENDPRSMARAMRKMGAEMGEDLGPEFSDVVDRLEAGESPDSIEQALPPEGGAGDGAPDMGDF